MAHWEKLRPMETKSPAQSWGWSWLYFCTLPLSACLGLDTPVLSQTEVRGPDRVTRSHSVLVAETDQNSGVLIPGLVGFLSHPTPPSSGCVGFGKPSPSC